jgi:FtsZ-binding cell division protein ZapB
VGKSDREFEDEMRKAGVIPLRKPGQPAPKAVQAAPPPRPPPPQAGRTTGPQDVRSSQPLPASPMELAAWRDELILLRAEVQKLSRGLRDTEDVNDTALAALAVEKQSEIEGLRHQLTTLWQERDALQHARDALDRERRETARQRTAIEREADTLHSRLARADKSSVLRARGLDDCDVQATALALLLDWNPQKTVQALCAADPEPLRELLNRLAIVCANPHCQPAPGTPVMPAPPESCEVCGGSDVQRAFVQFVAACRKSGIDRVTIVGGSPAYREKLRTLQREHGQGVQIDVVREERPQEAKRAAAVRGLVVTWGATEVDHTTTGHYRNAGDIRLHVAHRGIAGMLGMLAKMVEPERS